MKPIFSLALVALAATSCLASAEDIIEEFKITGTHVPDTTALGRVPKVTISSEEIKALAPNSFADVLRGVPGIDIMQQGGMGGMTFLSLRGGDPNFVVILIDGVKVNDPTNSRGGAFDLGTLDPAIIEKVEIFYGSYSPVYGSDALAGVISIVTKGHEEGKIGSASIKAGSGGMVGGNLHMAVPLADVASLSVAASYQDGDDSTFGDAFKRKKIVAALKSTGDKDFSWHMGLLYSDGEGASFPEDSGGERLAVIPTPETRNFSQLNASGGAHYQASSQWRINLNAAWSRRSEVIANPGIAPGVLFPVPAIDSDSEYERIDIGLTNIVTLSDMATLAFGAATASEDGGMDSFIDFGFPMPANYTLSRNSQSLFAEAGLDPIDNLHITTGVRTDKADMVKATTSRAIARWQVTPTSTISAQFSEGFKLPSFFALGHPFVGNADLRAERSKNYDVSLESSFLGGKLLTKASLYKNTFADLVDFDPVLFTNVNRSKVEAKGVELYASLQASEKLSLSGSVSHNKTNTFEPDVMLRRRPEWKGSLQVNYLPLEALSLTGRMIFNGSYIDSSIPTGMTSLDGFSRIDLSAAWTVAKDMSLRLNMSNIANNKYEEAVGFASAGRSLTASLSKSF